MDRRLAEIETNLLDTTSAMIDDRLQSLDLRRRPGNTDLLETVKNSFDDMDFVREVHYEDSDGELHLVIIRDHTPSASAYSAICSRVSDIEHSTDRFDMTQLILHESDVLPRYMRGTKMLFERPRDATDTECNRQPSRGHRRLHDPETLEIVKNSFDDMDSVRQVHYRYDGDRLKLIIAHDSEDFGPAHSAICNRIVKIEDSLDDVRIGQWILPESELAPRHLAGTKILLKR